MTKIVLLCAAGMSTSALVRKMKDAAKAEGYECDISAHSVSEAKNYQSADMILLGPSPLPPERGAGRAAEQQGGSHRHEGLRYDERQGRSGPRPQGAGGLSHGNFRGRSPGHD